MDDCMEIEIADSHPFAKDLCQDTEQIVGELDALETKNSIDVNDLPAELIGEHIFGYFDFINWIRFLSPVCRYWRHLATTSRLPRQLTAKVQPVSPTLFRILTEFKVDTLISQAGDLNHVMLALDHAPHLHTLVMQHSLPDNPTGRRTSFKNITTFSTTESSNLYMLKSLPNVKRLHINCPFTMRDHERLLKRLPSNVKELEICLHHSYPIDKLKLIATVSSLEKIYVQCSSTQEKIEGFNSDKIVFVDTNYSYQNISTIPYHEFFYRTGCTKLNHAGNDGDAKMMEDLLLNEVTTRVYEQDLMNRDIPYRFPSLAKCPFQKISEWKWRHYKLAAREFILTAGYLDFWDIFAYFIECGNIDVLLPQVDQYLPVPSYILRKFAEYAVKFNWALEYPEEFLTTMLNSTDDDGNSFFHILPTLPYTGDTSKYLLYADPNAQNSNGDNPATVAFNHGKFDLWLNWIQNGSEMQAGEYKGEKISTLLSSRFAKENLQTILELFFQYGEESGEPFIFKVLRYGQMWVSKGDSYRLSPVLDGLLKLHGHGQIYNKSGRSFLNEFIRNFSPVPSTYSTISLVYKLKEYNVDFNLVDEERMTPLTTAIEIHDLRICFDLLTRAAQVDLPDGSGVLPFMQLLSKKYCSDEFFYGAVKNFLDAGADLNQLDYDECGREMYPIGMAIKNGQPKYRIESLVSYGADLTLVDLDANNMLHVLLLNDDSDYVVEMIPYLAKHISVNAQNSFDETPIMVALRIGCNGEVIQQLCENGAEILLSTALNLARDLYQLTGLTIPELDPDTIRDCVERVVTRWPNESVHSLLSDENVRASVISRIRDPDSTDGPIIIDTLKSLFIYEESDFPMSGVRLAGAYHTQMRLFLSDICLTEFLLNDLGFNINTQNSLGETLLFHINLELDNYENIAEYLLESGLDASIRDDQGQTALDKFWDNPAICGKFVLSLAKHMQASGDKEVPIDIEYLAESINYYSRKVRFHKKLPAIDVNEVRKSRREKQLAENFTATDLV